jgi:hypothetical protein
MTLIDTTQVSPVSFEQVQEIETLAQSGQFADALIRLRKIKPLYPRNTFLVALEKQLERLLVLPRDSEASDTQKKSLLSSIHGLVRGAADSLRQMPAAQPQPEPPPIVPARTERDTARSQLKDQYFQHADEYLKKGAYGSALVEIRRVKIIAPNDPTVAEYERTIRQLVELQQRTGVKAQEAELKASTESDTPRAVAEASPTPAPQESTQHPQIKTFGTDELSAVEIRRPSEVGKSRVGLIALLVIVVLGLAVSAIAVFSNPDPLPTSNQQKEPVQPTAPPVVPQQLPEATLSQSAEVQADAVPVEQPVAAKPEVQSSALPAAKTQSNAAGTKPEVTSAKEQPKLAAPAPAPKFTETEPQIVHLEEPVLGAELSHPARGVEVIIMVQIDTEGKPIRTLVAKSTNVAFNSAIVTAVLRSTYRAGTTPNGPATKWLTIPFNIK